MKKDMEQFAKNLAPDAVLNPKSLANQLKLDADKMLRIYNNLQRKIKMKKTKDLIKLDITDDQYIEIDNPRDVIEEYSKKFYNNYFEHKYEENLNIGTLTDNALREKLLEKTFKGSKNTDLIEIINKVTLLNSFYHTQIPVINIVPIARHIESLKIDDELYCKDKIYPDLVNDIAYKQGKYKSKNFDYDNEDLHIKVNNIYSFATKYCSWHNPNYPIADRYSKGMLYYINKANPFYKKGKLTKRSLNDYNIFTDVYIDFKNKFFSLMPDINNKMIDTYLWAYSKRKIDDFNKNIDTKDKSKILADYIKLDSTEIPAKLRREKKYE